MIDLLASKSQRGDLNINQAKAYLAMHEWGQAKKAVENGLRKGGLSDPEGAMALLNSINRILGVDNRRRYAVDDYSDPQHSDLLNS